MFELVSWMSSPARFFEIKDVSESPVSFQHIALSVFSFKLTRTAAIHLPLFIHRYSFTTIHRPPFIIFISSIQYPIAPFFLFIVSPFHQSNKTGEAIDMIDAYWCLNSVKSIRAC